TRPGPKVRGPADALNLEQFAELRHAIWALGQPQPLVALAARRDGDAGDLFFEEFEWDRCRQGVRHIRDEDQAWQAVQPRLVFSRRPGQVGPPRRLGHAARPERQFLEGWRV